MAAHSAMPRGWLSVRGRVLSRVGIGVLTHVVPPSLVDEAVGDARETRFRSLPSRLGLYFVLGTCLFSGTPYAKVMESLTAGLGKALAAAGWLLPAVTALSGVRRRLGEEPAERLFRALCSALSPVTEPWMLVSGMVAVAWDGTAVAAEATAANVEALGRLGGKKGGHYPCLRLVALIAVGTRGIIDAAAGPATGKGTGERELAARCLGSLRAGMLLLADRGFYSWGLWHAAAATGADLLWRVTASMHLPVVTALPDGSWITRVEDPAERDNRYRKNKRRKDKGQAPDLSPVPALAVRVIEFTVTVTPDDGKPRTQRYRMITTLLDWQAHPAPELAAGYARRWAVELAYREIKASLRGPRILLTGATPGLASQHLWAYLAVYQAIRTLIARAAASAGLDPARLSFTAALAAARASITAARDDMPAALAAHEAAVIGAPVPERPGRVYPRTVKAAPPPYGIAKPVRTAISRHAAYTLTLTTPGTTTPQSRDQHKQPQKQAAAAP